MTTVNHEYRCQGCYSDTFPPLSIQGAVMNEMETELVGSDKYAARFGESIVNLGDIDNDGFEGN